MAEEPFDVFVSYAHADNDIAIGSSMTVGWVTALAQNLNTGPNVRKKRLFIDHQLRPGDAFSTDLLDKVRRSSVLVLLLSQNYVKSEWCGREVEHFIEAHAADPDKPTGVYVVELWPYDSLPHAPPAIQLLRKRLIASKFWFKASDASAPSLAGYPSPLECRPEGKELYWRVLSELQSAIDTRLAELSAAREVSAAAATVIAPPRDCLGTVLLADTTEDLEAQRNKVKALLEPEGIVVLPEGDYVGLSQPEFDSAVKTDLARADVFVQLLSSTAGRRGRLELPLPQLQYRRAIAAGKPVSQWAARQPDPGEIEDAGHAALFATATLRATHLADFANGIVAALRAEKAKRELPVPPTPPRGRRPIFIDDVAGERGLCERVRSIIKEHNFAWRSGQPPGGDIQEWLRPCVAGLTIYTDTSKREIAQNRLIHFLNQVADGNVDMEHWGVFMQSGNVASEFGFEAEGLVDVHEQDLVQFLRGISR